MQIPRLFNGVGISEEFEQRRGNLKARVERWGRNDLLSRNEDDLIADLVGTYCFDIPRLVESQIHQFEPKETSLLLNELSLRRMIGNEEAQHVPGMLYKVSIPFEGEASLLQVRPTTSNLSPPQGEISGDSIHLSYF